MWNSELIAHPFGIAVFGSAILRVAPDVASLVVVVSRVEAKPRDALAKARKGSEAVTAFLRQIRCEFGSSRVTLAPHQEFGSFGRKNAGYCARIVYHVILRDLERMEEILSGVVDAGATEVQSVTFQSSRLKEVRAEARRLAVDAAREKALHYCASAGVPLGSILHIEDVNPDFLTARAQVDSGHHGSRGPEHSDTDEVQLFDPGAIVVAGAVKIGYRITSS